MSMCRVFSCVVGIWCLLWPVCSLGRTLLTFALLHSVLEGQIYSRHYIDVLLEFGFLSLKVTLFLEYCSCQEIVKDFFKIFCLYSKDSVSYQNNLLWSMLILLCPWIFKKKILTYEWVNIFSSCYLLGLLFTFTVYKGFDLGYTWMV